MKPIFSILFLASIIFINQSKLNEVTGIYYSVNNTIKRWSIMELRTNGTFKYKYGLGPCQAEITGIYFAKNQRIKFKNDKEFTKEYLEAERDSLIKADSTLIGIGIPIYPDLSLTEWKIRKNSIKPISEIDCGCITEKGTHKRK